MDNLLEVNVIIENGTTMTDSRNISENFGKRHDHVLRDIENIKKDLPNFGEMFWEGEMLDSYGRPQKVYYMNRDGFSLLAMGFTGPKALEWKIKYITAFNKLEKSIKLLNNQDRSDLSPNTQTLYLMLDSIAEQERRINQVEKKVDDTVGDLKTIIEAIKSEANWRQGINNKIGQIVAAKGSTWEVEYPLLYRELETRARCDLAARKRNWIRRMLERGSTKTKANKTRKIDVIEDDPKLKEIFSKIVAENIIMYCI